VSKNSGKGQRGGAPSPASTEIKANKNGRKQRRKDVAKAREANNALLTQGMRFPTKTARRQFLDVQHSDRKRAMRELRTVEAALNG